MVEDKNIPIQIAVHQRKLSAKNLFIITNLWGNLHSILVGTVMALFKKEQNSDLGFGSVVSGNKNFRLINKDGSFNVFRKGLNPLGSLSIYHYLLTTTWPRFLYLSLLGYISLNVFFALLYVAFGREALFGEAVTGFTEEFLRAFFFSVQTATTIGYGHITPSGIIPNLIVTIESFVGMLGFASITGLLFARISRPHAKLQFSEKALFAPYKDNLRAFEFRIANTRSYELIELEALVTFSWMEEMNGVKKRRYERLPLERSKVPFFPTFWTVVHPIDDASPLNNITFEKLVEIDAEFLILLKGTEEAFSQTVHRRYSYKAEEVVFNAKFSSIFIKDSSNNFVSVDISRLGEYEIVAD